MLKTTVWDKTLENWIKKTRKIGKSYFLYQCPFAMEVYQFSVCRTMPSMTCRKCESIRLQNTIILGQNVWKLKENSFKFWKFYFRIIFLSQCKIINAVCIVLRPLCHFKHISQQGSSTNTTYRRKRTKIEEKLQKNLKILDFVL